MSDTPKRSALPFYADRRDLWGKCCTLFPCVRQLIQVAHQEKYVTFPEDYQVTWLPDLPLLERPPRFVTHDCRRVPPAMLGGDKTPRTTSVGFMKVLPERFTFSWVPHAAHYCLVACCDNCKAVFFASCWGPDDTLENFVRTLKRSYHDDRE